MHTFPLLGRLASSCLSSLISGFATHLKLQFDVPSSTSHVPMAAKNTRFVSRTLGDFTSQLTHRNTMPVDEETNSPTTRTRWLGFGGRTEQLPRLARGITMSDEEKIHVAKTKKLGTFSGVCDAVIFLVVGSSRSY